MLIRKDFDEMAAKEGQGKKLPLPLHGKCHEEAPCEVSYVGNGVLQIKCSTCQELIANVKISEVD